MARDFFPDREGLVIQRQNGKLTLEAVPRGFEPEPKKLKPRPKRWFARSGDIPMFFLGIWCEWVGKCAVMVNLTNQTLQLDVD